VAAPTARLEDYEQPMYAGSLSDVILPADKIFLQVGWLALHLARMGWRQLTVCYKAAVAYWITIKCTTTRAPHVQLSRSVVTNEPFSRCEQSGVSSPELASARHATALTATCQKVTWNLSSALSTLAIAQMSALCRLLTMM
jgi:hypothetical protein